MSNIHLTYKRRDYDSVICRNRAYSTRPLASLIINGG